MYHTEKKDNQKFVQYRNFDFTKEYLCYQLYTLYNYNQTVN